MRCNHIFIFSILLLLLCNYSISEAQTAAVFINVPCDSVVREEFIKWREDQGIRRLFSSILILDDIPETIPMKNNIIFTIRELYNNHPQSVYFFIYGIQNPDQRLLSLDYQEIQQELFVINEHYLAPKIVIMDINKSFTQFNFQLPSNESCELVRAELLNNLQSMRSLRQQLTNYDSLSIDILRQFNTVTISPLEPPQERAISYTNESNLQTNTDHSSQVTDSGSDKFFDQVTLPPVTKKITQSPSKNEAELSNVDNPQENISNDDVNSSSIQTIHKTTSQTSQDHTFSEHSANKSSADNTQSFTQNIISTAGNPLGLNSVNNPNSLVFYMKYIKRPERTSHVLQIISNDDFKTCKKKTYPYDFDNLISKSIESNYLYVFRSSNGNSLEVYHKNEGNMVFNTKLKVMPQYNELVTHSTEFTSPQTNIFAFTMPGQVVGICIKQKDSFYFSELDCMGKEIETMTIASRSSIQKQDGLVYIQDQSLKFHSITKDTLQSVANDSIWYTEKNQNSSRKLLNKNMFGAKLIWWPPNALILAKDIGLFWMNRKLVPLYKRQKPVTNYHVDIFYSGDNTRLGFVWSGIDTDKKISVWMGLQQEDKTIKQYRLTDHILNEMKSQNIKKNQKYTSKKETKDPTYLPWLYLKDRSQSFDQLHGALIFNKKNENVRSCQEEYIVKYIFIDISNNNVSIHPQRSEKKCGLISYNDIKVLSQYKDKLIVHIVYKRNSITSALEPNFVPLFTYPDDSLDF